MRRTVRISAVALAALLGAVSFAAKIENTVRYLGVDVGEAPQCGHAGGFLKETSSTKVV